MKKNYQKGVIFYIHQRTSLNSDPYMITKLNVNRIFFENDNIKKLDISKFNIEKTIYDNLKKRYIRVSLEFTSEDFLKLKRSKGKNKFNYRVELPQDSFTKDLYKVFQSRSLEVLGKNKVKKYDTIDCFLNSKQDRAIEGIKFENLIRDKMNWYKPKGNKGKPIIKWPGESRSNYEKINNYLDRVSEFIPLNDSVYDKYDAINIEGDKIEIKKYILDKVRGKWILFSEPFFKVATQKDIERLKRVFGYDYKSKYNRFVEEFEKIHLKNEFFINQIKKTFIGVQFDNKNNEFESSFVETNKLNFRYNISNWNGFKRIQIQFKVKN